VKAFQILLIGVTKRYFVNIFFKNATKLHFCSNSSSVKKKNIFQIYSKNYISIKADKSNSVVAVDRTDYIQRMLDLISDGPYEEINFNPLDNMIKAVKTTLNTVKLKFNIEVDGEQPKSTTWSTKDT
jgi:hypothetical protein